MEPKTFCFDDYDAIGFDLDCTIIEYNEIEVMRLVYDHLAEYLVNDMSYESEFLFKPFKDDNCFLQKGLFMDLKKGNVLKIDEENRILVATHGTRSLSSEEIENIYGPDRKFGAFKGFYEDPLLIINTPHEQMLKAQLDIFEIPCILLFARIVDYLDELNGNKPLDEYHVYSDIKAALCYLYKRNHGETTVFLSSISKNIGLYVKKLSPEKLNWLRELKSKKFVFLLTGAYLEFADFIAKYCIGEDWKSYFHVVVTYALKPFFFFNHRSFLHMISIEEGEPVNNGLELNGVYSQGNWKELKSFIAKGTNKEEPKCLYIGDNLIQDVYTPVHLNCCHTIAVSVELNENSQSCKLWGSYFGFENKIVSYWNSIIRNHACVCVSGLDAFVKKPFDYKYCCLGKSEKWELNESNGYYVE